MRGIGPVAAICMVLAAFAIAAPTALAAGGPADWMYEPTSFTEIHLTLPPDSISELEAEPKEYVEGTFELAETDGVPGTAGPFSAPLKVGIELKGGERPAELAAYLGEPVPSPGVAAAACPPLRPIGGFPPPPTDEPSPEASAPPGSGGGTSSPTPTPSTTSSAAPASPAAGSFALDRRRIAGRSIALTLEVPGPGRLTVEGSSGGRVKKACVGGSTATAAGSLETVCRLTGRFAALLHNHWRRVVLDVRFEPADGAPEDIRRTIHLRRR